VKRHLAKDLQELQLPCLTEVRDVIFKRKKINPWSGAIRALDLLASVAAGVYA